MHPHGPHHRTSVLDRPVSEFLQHDFIALPETWTCARALEEIRLTGDDHKVSYFYTVDDDDRLCGVIPVRRFLTAPADRLLGEMAFRNLVTVGDHETMADVARSFQSHKFLSLPVVRADGSVAGVVDLKALAGEEVDHSNRAVVEEVFQTIGVRLEALTSDSLWAVWWTRFPWLLSTLASGFFCAWLSSRFSSTLEKNILLSFFIALVLALGESIAIQSMTFSFQELHKPAKERRRYPVLFAREVAMALALGLPIGLVVGAMAFVIQPRGDTSLVIGTSIAVSILCACLVGLVLPWVLKLLKVEPKVAAGPLVLALTDISTVLTYLVLATVMLK
jgi:magnesium transporter